VIVIEFEEIIFLELRAIQNEIPLSHEKRPLNLSYNCSVGNRNLPDKGIILFLMASLTHFVSSLRDSFDQQIGKTWLCYPTHENL
jgi:hypothetical protein